jgi:hypothetical protein
MRLYYYQRNCLTTRQPSLIEIAKVKMSVTKTPFQHRNKSQQTDLDKKQKTYSSEDIFKFKKFIHVLNNDLENKLELHHQVKQLDHEFKQNPCVFYDTIWDRDSGPEPEVKLLAHYVKKLIPWRCMQISHNSSCFQGYFPYKGRLFYMMLGINYKPTDKQRTVDFRTLRVFKKDFSYINNFGDSNKTELFSEHNLKTPGIVQERVDIKLDILHRIILSYEKQSKLFRQLKRS